MASRSPLSSPDSATGSGTDPARPDTGEPLGGSDSDSDLGLGEEGCGAGDLGYRLEETELEAEFEAAAERLRGLVQTASREQLLYLYARYKQAGLEAAWGHEQRTGHAGVCSVCAFAGPRRRPEGRDF
ncbi:acyl-CoA-binding domain-containing protein 6-like isoform X1 [Lepisosteus oculatus]|uniref:acyl-CoA-binding domain-containing protein 6-like n=1 Tax=Lepisosteus oculatus TaxID=7918 RepID=UPI0035F52D48